MPYQFVDHTADIAFQAQGKDLLDLMRSASEATLQTMVEQVESVLPQVTRRFELKNVELDMLLFDLLQELIFYKDAEGLLLKPCAFDLEQSEGGEFRLKVEAKGEVLDPERHEQRADIKAVTMHRFRLENTSSGWECFVILDV